MGRSAMKIGVLTSSRADYGFYQPLLKKLKNDSFFELEIIAFGTHLSRYNGYTVTEIKNDGFGAIHTMSSLISNDDEESISSSYGLTVLKFAQFWPEHKYDFVFCFGDRFEMSAAVQSGIPFGIKFVHFYGGDTTRGAIDNIYRHQMSLASTLHFTSTDTYKEKVSSMIASDANVFSIGSLSLDGIEKFEAKKKEDLYSEFSIPKGDFALVTFHPETISPARNTEFARETKIALESLLSAVNLVITMPNADTSGTAFRTMFNELKSTYESKIAIVENFGSFNYFSAMKHSSFLIGNSSSGIVEAASFNKYVVNVGERQAGRAQSENILNCSFNSNEILSKSLEAKTCGIYMGKNIYYKKHIAETIVKIFKTLHEKL